MSLKNPNERKKHILNNIASKTINEVAGECGVTEKTIDRDIAKLKASGEWFAWIEAELLRLHKSPDIDDDIKYREMSKLYAKGITAKHEVETSGNIKYVLEMWRPNIDGDKTTDET